MKYSIAKALFVTGIVLAISACSTSYHRNGWSGGFKDTQLDENVFRVAFHGNGYTSRERVSDFVLLRSAELAIENGFKYFSLIDSQSYSSVSSHTTQKSSNTTFSATQSGNNVFGNANTTTSGGKTYYISKPSQSAVVICYNEKPSEQFSFNAEFIFKSLTKKYKIKTSD